MRASRPLLIAEQLPGSSYVRSRGRPRLTGTPPFPCRQMLAMLVRDLLGILADGPRARELSLRPSRPQVADSDAACSRTLSETNSNIIYTRQISLTTDLNASYSVAIRHTDPLGARVAWSALIGTETDRRSVERGSCVPVGVAGGSVGGGQTSTEPHRACLIHCRWSRPVPSRAQFVATRRPRSCSRPLDQSVAYPDVDLSNSEWLTAP